VFAEDDGQQGNIVSSTKAAGTPTKDLPTVQPISILTNNDSTPQQQKGSQQKIAKSSNLSNPQAVQMEANNYQTQPISRANGGKERGRGDRGRGQGRRTQGEEQWARNGHGRFGWDEANTATDGESTFVPPSAMADDGAHNARQSEEADWGKKVCYVRTVNGNEETEVALGKFSCPIPELSEDSEFVSNPI
jgi:hypothetical protein